MERVPKPDVSAEKKETVPPLPPTGLINKDLITKNRKEIFDAKGHLRGSDIDNA